MTKHLFASGAPLGAQMAANKALRTQVVKQRYDVYLEEALSGRHTSQAQALGAAGSRCGTSDDRLRRQFRDLGYKLVEIKLPELPPVGDALSAEEVLRQQLADKTEELRRNETLRLRDISLIKGLRKEIFDRDAEDEKVAEASSLRFNPFVIQPHLHEPSSPGFPGTMWSDLHIGEEVTSREMGGLNVFNRDIAWQRMDRLVTGTIKLWRNYAGLRPEYPGVWLNLGGDIISGGIHEELRETNWGTIEEQAVDAGELIIAGLLGMADAFAVHGVDAPKIYVPCVVGNHGRHSLKPVAKRHVRENREWGIYKSLQAQLATDDRFVFFIPDQPDFHYEVYGHKFMLTHGNQIGARGGDGHIGAVGPITRGSMKTNWAEMQIGMNFDTMIIGHYHAYSPRGVLVPVIVNGAFKGFDEYAMNVLRVPYSPPMQAAWMVSPTHGIVNQTAVDLR